VVLRADGALKGARALLVLRRMEALGTVHGVEPAPTALGGEEFDGRFAFRIETQAPAERIEADARAAGDVETVRVHTAGGEAAEGERDAGRARHIRVDLRRLDVLMNVIGELVAARGRLEHLIAERRDPELAESVAAISGLTRQLQSEILQARMTPVWQVFDRFPRVVRDLARQLDKQVEFRVEGKEIELDRAILDEIGDPLIHLLRNAVDHGIESPDQRVAAGKPAAGQITLAAMRDRDTVVIMVSDDGRGIDRARILAEAKRRGLVDEHAPDIPDDQLLRVLGRSGFSTAGRVSEVSGRGVGVDVILTRMRELGGSVEVRSVPARGAASPSGSRRRWRSCARCWPGSARSGTLCRSRTWRRPWSWRRPASRHSRGGRPSCSGTRCSRWCTCATCSPVTARRRPGAPWWSCNWGTGAPAS
jgi:two-component system chemotaxis sensor kinase CheA